MFPRTAEIATIWVAGGLFPIWPVSPAASLRSLSRATVPARKAIRTGAGGVKTLRVAVAANKIRQTAHTKQRREGKCSGLSGEINIAVVGL